jgi:hypothetical protein
MRGVFAGAAEDAADPGALGGQHRRQGLVHGIELVVAHGAARDLRLVGADRHIEAGAVQSGYCIGRAGDELKPGGRLDVVLAVDHDDAVAIEQEQGHAASRVAGQSSPAAATGLS